MGMEYLLWFPVLLVLVGSDVGDGDQIEDHSR